MTMISGKLSEEKTGAHPPPCGELKNIWGEELPQ